jgi:hypothetical protein
MNQELRFLLPALLVAVIISAFSYPVIAPVANPDLVVEPQTITTVVSTNFNVEIWIRNLPDPMVAFDFGVKWDPAMMQYKSHVIHGNGWSNLQVQTSNVGNGELFMQGEGGPLITSDAKWLSITFHCLGEGTSIIEVMTIDTIWVQVNGERIPLIPDEFDGTVHQTPPRPVGGHVAPVNKLAVLTPYFALAGLVAAVSTVVVIKRKRA